MELVFDTLAFAKRLESVGFTRPQAEALADEQSKLIDERLATKRDIGDLRTDWRAELKAAEIRLEARIVSLEQKTLETKAEIIKWVVGIGFAQVAMILAVLKLHM